MKVKKTGRQLLASTITRGSLYQRGGPLAHTLAFDDDSTTEVLEEAEFQTKVLGELKSANKKVTDYGSKQEKLLTDFDRLDKDTKKAFEELTLIKRGVNDQQATFDTFAKKLAEVRQRVDAEVRLSFGDPLTRVMRDEEMRIRFNAAARLAITRGNDRYQRDAIAWLSKLGEDAKKKALGEDGTASTTPGANMIDDRLAGEIYDLIAGYGIWNTVEVVDQLTRDYKFPVDTADPLAVFILTEGGTLTDDTAITGTQVTATAEVVATLLNVSMQLLEDSEYDVTAWLMKKFARAYAKRLDYATFRGDGTADTTNGGMTGVFNAGTSITTGAGSNKVENTTLTDWVNMMVVTEALFERPSRWWMHPFTLSRAVLVRDDNGRPIFQTALEAPSAGAIGSILGRPVTTGNILNTGNTTGQKVVAYGDPGGQVNGIRKAFTFEASDHHKWNTLQRSFRGWGRFATKNRSAAAFVIMTLGA